MNDEMKEQIRQLIREEIEKLWFADHTVGRWGDYEQAISLMYDGEELNRVHIRKVDQ